MTFQRHDGLPQPYLAIASVTGPASHGRPRNAIPMAAG